MSRGEKQLDPRGRELERERQPVQADAQLRDRVGVQLGELEVGPCVACAIDEEPHRLGPPETVDLERARRIGSWSAATG